MERQLATIRKIAEVQAIPNADKICAYRVDGWWVVDSVGKYNVGDLVVYLEIDSWVPNSIAPFLSKGKEPKEFEGVKGERLRTVKLRGFTSQGLLLPLSILGKPEEIFPINDDSIGADVTQDLGILKYEKPLPAALAGVAKGNFPSFIPKTDQPRIQNCTRNFEKWVEASTVWEVTEKLDGSSMTVYVKYLQDFKEDEPSFIEGVCSRNLDLKQDEANPFWEATIKYDLHNKLMSIGRSLAIQGELVGEGIQGNPYKLTGRQFFCFDIWDIDNQKYLLPEERRQLCFDLDIQHVPYFGRSLLGGLFASQSDVLADADGMSVVGAKPAREGLVYKSETEHDVSFKAISNAWLLGGGE